jgi:Fic family protein
VSAEFISTTRFRNQQWCPAFRSYDRTKVLAGKSILPSNITIVRFNPFLDGNGRVGRLLITFMLCAEEVLREPVLYLSLFFKKHRRLYYDRLNETRESEGLDAWLDFFLQGVRDTANQAARTAGNIDRLFNADKEKIERFGRGAASGLLVYRYAQANPLFAIRNAAREMKVSFPTASAAVDRVIEVGILRESSGKRRGRLFLYESYLDILNRDS